jgi:hypothetical protein
MPCVVRGQRLAVTVLLGKVARLHPLISEPRHYKPVAGRIRRKRERLLQTVLSFSGTNASRAGLPILIRTLALPALAACLNLPLSRQRRVPIEVWGR